MNDLGFPGGMEYDSHFSPEVVEIVEVGSGLTAKLRQALLSSKQYGLVGVRYLAGADIVDYIKAHESIRDKVKPRTRIERAVQYFNYAKTFVGRLAPTLLEFDGIRNIAEGRYKIGVLELLAGVYKNASDYYAIRGRDAYNRTVSLAKKLLESKPQ